MRPILVILAATLVAAPALAQKPGDDPAPAMWRAEALRLCVAELFTADGLTAPDRDSICGCAADRYLDTHQQGPPPELNAAAVRSELGGRILACTIERQPNRATAVSRWLAQRTPSAPPPPVVVTPVAPDEGGKPPADAEEDGRPATREGGGLSGWWESLRARIAGSGLPLWAWVPIIAIVLLFLRGLFRRSDRTDLTGPPRR